MMSKLLFGKRTKNQLAWGAASAPINESAFGCLLVTCVLSLHAWSAGNWQELTNASAFDQTIDANVRDRFLKEAPLAWEAMRNDLAGFQIEVRTESDVKKGKKTRRSVKTRSYSVAEDSRLQLAREIANNGTTAISISNERQSFVVKKDGPDIGYYVTKVKQSPTKATEMAVVLSNLAGTLASAWSIWWIPIDDIVDNPDFELIHASLDRASSPHVSTVAYRYVGKSGVSALWQPGAIYWAKCLPDDSWRVTESGVTNFNAGGSPLVVRVLCSYQPWFKTGKIINERLVEYYEPAKADVTEIDRATVGVPTTPNVTRDEFYLPYYGIDESSVHLATASSANHAWLILATAVMCVVLFFVVRRKHLSLG
jgi:hypothetical protein